MAKPAGLTPDKWVTELVPDPGTSDVAELFVMRGYIGASPQTGYWRLYQNHALSEWFEILETDIKQVIGGTDAPGDDHIVMVARGAVMHHVSLRRAEPEFITGPVLLEALRRMPSAGQSDPWSGWFPTRAPGGPEPTKCPGCPSTSP